MQLPWRQPSEAGRAAAAYYERAFGAWRRRLRAPLYGVGLLVGVGAVSLWLYSPQGEFMAGIWLGATWGMILWALGEPPEYIARWKRGAEAERRTAKTLRSLVRSEWHSFHDREGARGNLDHIVVGPGGVFLLDTKSISGSVTLESAGLTVRYADAPRNHFTYSALGRQMTSAAVRLKERIEADVRIRTYVQAVVVVWGHFPECWCKQDDVVYGAGERLTEWLTGLPAKLASGDRRLIQLALEAGLVAPPAEPIAEAGSAA